jgi:hypothetical protein
VNESEAFAEFDEELKLEPAERKAAQRLHNEMTQLLIRAGVIVSAFLQGSFARKTMLAPLRDIDKIVIMAGRLADQPDLQARPELAMDRIEAVLARAYPHARFSRSRHALRVDFGADTFSFDIVPAFETLTIDDDVLIADIKDNRWERSNTRELIRTVADRNQDCDGQFIHQVRMGKQHVAHRLDSKLPGLHVESIAYEAILEPLDHPQACRRIFETGARLLIIGYTDPTGQDLISRRLDPEVKALAQAEFAEAARLAREAQRLAAAGDDAAAIAIWHELFGDPFPNPPAQTARDALASSFAGGSVTSTGRVTTSRAGRQNIPPTRSWRS